MLTRRRRFAARHQQRGFSLVELMVGTAIGLFVVAGTVSLYATNANNSRRLLLEARLNQDLRSAMDLVSRDLRRAGYWGNAINGTNITGSGGATVANPYRGIDSASADQVTYQFSHDATEDEVGETEHFGFRLQDGVLQMQTQEDHWEPMTDGTLVTVSEFSIDTTATELALGGLCATACAVGAPNCPAMTVRQFVIRLRGQSVSDTSVQRTLEARVRPRNDQLEGQCPA
ncbi:MAG TPA: prepilin-type N-terminal cleavage/methylation domain-containing protein [Ideonella sp.]|uniref:PilW family protein n=1 Tax=Ideonella sp. TaxID=1929293 RepID=UPI002E2F6F73|nr:prepilin-type N-terminal cleavage/methylation domain-containing protein [Ideonella sp.]HEX5683799.1 prepilin-type N-terminal cleavage/methylation domain-containing protein [Ideonella sp.]